jgi:pimeloyl-ACP methyl ester carboxylesterase
MAKSTGSFWSRGPGLLLLTILVLVGGAAAGSYALIYSVTHPPRDRSQLEPADLLLQTEDALFQGSDGTPLSGWFVKGAPARPAIILCHDLGGARSSLLNSAASLNRAGYPLLLFDFRGHGQSGGKGSTLGLSERLDVLGAIDFLKTRHDIDTTRFGVWGIGMGAYAGALAAVESKEIVALALDSIYPEIAVEVDRRLKEAMPPMIHPALPVIRLLEEPYFAFKLTQYSVTRLLPDLGGRNLLFIASSDLPERFGEVKALYASVPEVQGGDKNLLELKASVVSGLYAEDKKLYDQAITRFFSTYLRAAGTPPPGAGKKIQVLER